MIDFKALVVMHSLTEDLIAKVSGISPRTARAYIAGEKHCPEPVRRLLAIYCREEKLEDYLSD